MTDIKSEKNSSNGGAEDAIMAAEGLDERTKRNALKGIHGPPDFTLSSLWTTVINPVNLKSYTLNLFDLRDPYCRNFHLAWLGFFVAFFSWFAFPPLIPEAIRADLGLLPIEVANSNIVALCATLVGRVVMGPLVDKYGPRRCMAGLLIAGAIPSGLAGAVFNVNGLYAIRFFIGILGCTFVCSVAWASCFFDKKVVGTANALVAGWGNAGGGIVFIVQTAIFSGLVNDGVSQHNAWRACFAITPVPLCLIVAVLTLVFGTDHPAGKWSMRHTTPATAIAVARGGDVHLDAAEKRALELKRHEKEAGTVKVAEATEEEAELDAMVTSGVDTAVNQELTWKDSVKILLSPYTWLPALMYFTTFGFELAFDSNFANTLYAVYFTTGKDTSFTQLHAGYLTSILGILNFVTRPLGGLIADQIYIRGGGVRSKKYITIVLGIITGAMSLGLGLYMNAGLTGGTATPSLGPIIAFEVLAAIACELANGSNFSLVPHCNTNNNGVMSGLVGAMGNLGGIFFALVFRFQNPPVGAPGKPYWIMGVVCMAVNVICILIPCPSS